MVKVKPMKPLVANPAYVPDRGDLIWLDFDPQAGKEQAGRRPALVLSPLRYNRTVRLCLCCPITSQIKGYPFEVALPPGSDVGGVVLSDHLKSLDWQVRRATRSGRAGEAVVAEVLGKLKTILG